MGFMAGPENERRALTAAERAARLAAFRAAHCKVTFDVDVTTLESLDREARLRHRRCRGARTIELLQRLEQVLATGAGITDPGRGDTYDRASIEVPVALCTAARAAASAAGVSLSGLMRAAAARAVA